MTISRTRWYSWRAPRAGSEAKATPSVKLASATIGRRPMRRGRSVRQTTRSQPSRARLSRATAMIRSSSARSKRSHPTRICQDTWSSRRSASSSGSSPANRSASSAGRSGSASKPSTTPSRRPDRPPSVAATAASHHAALACSTAWLAHPPERHLRRWRRLGRGSGPSQPLHRWSGRHDPEGSSLGLVGNLVDQRLKALVLIYRPRRGPAGRLERLILIPNGPSRPAQMQVGAVSPRRHSHRCPRGHLDAWAGRSSGGATSEPCLSRSPVRQA